MSPWNRIEDQQVVLETKKPIKSWTGAEEAVLWENLMEGVSW